MSGIDTGYWAKKADRVELNFAIGDLALASELMRKGSVGGMIRASKLLRNVWTVIKDGTPSSDNSEEWKKVEKAFFKLSGEYIERVPEVAPLTIDEINRPLEVG
jgi:hypothetical protein